MAKVEIYTRPMCGFCVRAKRLLDRKGVAYAEYDIWAEAGRKAEMQRRNPGASTVPQVFIDDRALGGSDELATLEANGDLDRLLGLAA